MKRTFKIAERESSDSVHFFFFFANVLLSQKWQSGTGKNNNYTCERIIINQFLLLFGYLFIYFCVKTFLFLFFVVSSSSSSFFFVDSWSKFKNILISRNAMAMIVPCYINRFLYIYCYRSPHTTNKWLLFSLFIFVFVFRNKKKN